MCPLIVHCTFRAARSMSSAALAITILCCVCVCERTLDAMRAPFVV